VTLSRRSTLALALIFALLGLLPQALSRTLPDIAFPLWAAERMQHGARLYVDILEINPPLFIWLDLPLVWLSRVTGLGSITCYRIATSLLLFASLAGCWWALKRSLGDERVEYRRVLWLAAAFALLLLPRLDWGEREHLSLALTLPYILLGVARARGRQVPRGGAIVAGLAAGIGIAFKPHFVLVWVGREMAARRWTRLRAAARQTSPDGDAGQSVIARPEGPKQSGRLRVNPETIVVPLLCIAYLISVILIHPEYFHLVRELGWAYSGFVRNSPTLAVAVFLGNGATIVLGALIVALALRAIPKQAAVWRVLIASMLGYFMAAVFQLKGRSYHLYPSAALAMLLLAAMAWDVRQMVATGIMRLFAELPATALITSALVAGALAVAQIATPLAPRYDEDASIGLLIPVVHARAAGRPVYVVSPHFGSAFPLLTYAGAEWPARLPSLWPVATAYDSASGQRDPIRFRAADSMTPPERFAMDVTVSDFLRSTPPLVLISGFRDEPGWGQQRLDLLRWLRLDPRFSAAWAAYEKLGVVGSYSVWARRGDSLASRALTPEPSRAGTEGYPPEAIQVNGIAVATWAVMLAILAIRIWRRREAPA
jgi:hypothetical protein